ncbi:MFS transporter [Desmospora activa]|uniref:Putative MFS family arabinose efflux permease n=1 Tax=Desmospora activa DSM 45169 TaxID=1121389 RepID=A0A2T4Z6F4_9BACL|nr:MFS transporter [Desmospora activa]PTM57456.1 putative MFS family arabinose efflux permease [Desmospora activa DSM 45169]
MKELLRQRVFVLLWAGQIASGLGGMFATFVEGWLIFELTGSKMLMGSLHMTYLIPLLLVQLLVGPFLDRWDLRKVMVASELIRGAAYLFPAVMLTLGLLQPWHLFVSAMLMGCTEPLFRPAAMAYLPSVVSKEKLVKANSLLEGTMSFAMLAGPPVAGLLLMMWDAHVILYLLVVLMAIAGALIWFLPPKKKIASTQEKGAWVQQFREGVSFYKVQPVLLGTGLLIMVGNLCFSAANPMYLPYVLEVLGGTTFHYGLLMSSLSLGMIGGSLFMGWIAEPRRKKPYMLGANLIGGLCLGLLSLVYWYPLAIGLAAISGFFLIWFNILNTTLYQRFVPEELRGRVFSLRILLAQGGMPVGAFVGGITAESWGVTTLFALAGGLVVIASVVAWFLPVFRQLDQEWVESKKPLAG